MYGDIYRFSHRSFQAYFAAYYTAYFLTDEQQKRLFSKMLLRVEVYSEQVDYYRLLMQIEPERFAENALEDGLRKLYQAAQTAPYPDEFLLKSAFEYVRPAINISCDHRHSLAYGLAAQDDNFYDFNILSLFSDYAKSDFPKLDRRVYDENIVAIEKYANRILSPDGFCDGAVELGFEKIDASDCITEEQRRQLYGLIVQCRWSNGAYDSIS